MAETILVRHGQASLGADNYDQLSPLGHQQARWLGEHFRSLNRNIDRILMGTLVRHRETAEGFQQGFDQSIPVEVVPGFDELSSKGLFNNMQKNCPDLLVDTGNLRRDYHDNMDKALSLWVSGELETDGNVSWPVFCENIKSAFETACDGSAKRTLVVTSGGPISVIMGHVLELDSKRILDLIVRIRNSSTTHFLYRDKQISLDCFNDISHLSHPDRHQHITFV